MEIVTWNIQCGLGVDGRVDLPRIGRAVRSLADPDVVCFQEVARHIPAVDLGEGADQVAHLSAEFPGYAVAFGAALDWCAEDGMRRQFGNLVLSRRPLIQIFRYLLPRPAQLGIKHMMRQATEIVVPLASAALRVVTTHLEYHSEVQRRAQVAYLRMLHQEACANQREPPLALQDEPYAVMPRPARAVFCGDFNITVGDSVYQMMTAPFEDGAPQLVDTWPVARAEEPHEPTCGVFDRVLWPQGPHCRDFFFVTGDLTERVAAVEVDTRTDASDHQPVRLVLSE